jgi:hypothetical protein
MRPDDFFIIHDDPLGLSGGVPGRILNLDLLTQLRKGPLPGRDDAEAAVALARLVHDELEEYGTSGRQVMTDDGMSLALLALRGVVERLNLPPFDPPFRDLRSFKAYWLREKAWGSWQARRVLLENVFGPLHDALADAESRALASTLAEAVSPHARTGWGAVDTEINEMRRHFRSATTAQDYRAVGNDCVAALEALSRQAYDPARHLRAGETEPPVANTKQRLERVIEDALPGVDNERMRRLARATIEIAQEVKHSTTPTRRDAGMAADSVILVANMIRRIAEPV